MATKVVMEALSPTMEEGRLIEWKKQEGEVVAAGDVLAEVETDKAVMELVARAPGVLRRQLVPAGATVPVSTLVAVIAGQDEDITALLGNGSAAPAAPAAKTAGAAETAQPVAAAPAVTAAPPAAAAPAVATAPATPTDGGRVKASPLARKIAAERGVDLAGIAGSGPGGRVVQRDVEGAPAAAPAAPARPARVLPDEGYVDEPLTQIRKTIAKRLVQSLGPVPTFFLTTEVDMERAWDAREALKALGPEGKISFNDIILKAAAATLRQHPACNAWWQDDHIRYWRDVHVGVAVAVEDGLITPVVRHADRKSLREISAEVRDMAGRARERRLKPEEYTGATFSISNLGMYDISHFTAIINPPEAGILAIGGIVEKPVVVDGQVTVRRRMQVTMSCDHRVIDGATGAGFLKTLKALLENPLALVW
jgi:pyruvate dehydrogenase E2 component (dihydrolipoamide acetyltransferase)